VASTDHVAADTKPRRESVVRASSAHGGSDAAGAASDAGEESVGSDRIVGGRGRRVSQAGTARRAASIPAHRDDSDSRLGISRLGIVYRLDASDVRCTAFHDVALGGMPVRHSSPGRRPV
jgi:hypothetical protein